jgi:chromosomal replication initiator protein
VFITTEQYLTQFVAAISSNSVPAFAARMRKLDVLLIDDIQFIAGKSGLQEELFHTLNTLYDLGSQVVISCDSKPDGIQDLEERLRTRFSQGLVVDVQPPDIETRMAILNSLAERIGFWLPADVCALIANRVSDNVRSLEGALRQVYARSNLFNDAITADLAESVLRDLVPASEVHISVELILEETAEVSGYSVDQLVSASRKRALVEYRKIAMHLSRDMTNHSLAELGGFFDRDHTTVLHAIKTSEERLAEKADFYDRYVKVQRAIQDRVRSGE